MHYIKTPYEVLPIGAVLRVFKVSRKWTGGSMVFKCYSRLELVSRLTQYIPPPMRSMFDDILVIEELM